MYLFICFFLDETFRTQLSPNLILTSICDRRTLCQFCYFDCKCFQLFQVCLHSNGHNEVACNICVHCNKRFETRGKTVKSYITAGQINETVQRTIVHGRVS